jgi:hypothetical protein
MLPPKLKSLHRPSSLSPAKLNELDRLPTEALLRSLQPGEKGSLKVRPDGTVLDGPVLDGHHRVHILRLRGVDVDILSREIVEKSDLTE